MIILIRTGLEWFRWSGHWYSHSGDAASLVSEENKIKIKIPQIQEIPIFSQIRKLMKKRSQVFSPWEELQVDHLPSSRGIQEPETGRYTGAWAFGSVSESWFFRISFDIINVHTYIKIWESKESYENHKIIYFLLESSLCDKIFTLFVLNLILNLFILLGPVLYC